MMGREKGATRGAVSIAEERGKGEVWGVSGREKG
jgi:hypothetical protein